MSADGSLNLFLALNLGVPSSDLELINIQYSINQYSKFMALNPLAYYTVSSSDFEKIIFVYFVCICCFFASMFSLVILSQISVTCSNLWYWKLSFCVTSFWFYYHQLWWSHWHAMLSLFLLYVILVWIFSGHDLFQVLGTGTSCVLYIICFQFIPLNKSCSIVSDCTWFIALLASPYALLFPTCLCLFLTEFDSSIYISIQSELHWQNIHSL